MIKIHNTSSSSVQLKFKNAAGVYTKPLRANAVLKLTEKEYKELLPLDPVVSSLIKVTKYSIHGTKSAKVEIYNPTNDRIVLSFIKSEADRYEKVLPANGTLTLNENEFALIKNLDSRLETVKMGTSHRAFIAAVESLSKPNPREEIPAVTDTIEVPEEDDKEEDKPRSSFVPSGKFKHGNKNGKK